MISMEESKVFQEFRQSQLNSSYEASSISSNSQADSQYLSEYQELTNSYKYPFEKLIDEYNEEILKPQQFKYNEQESYQFIKGELSDMINNGYDFVYSQKLPDRSKRTYVPKNSGQNVIKYIKVNHFRRRAVLKYQCVPSKRIFRKRYDKICKCRWNSFYGLVQFSYKIVELTKRELEEFEWTLHFPYKLLFNFKIFKQRCLKCTNWGRGTLYKSKLITIARMFCYTIAQALQCLKNNKKPKAVKQFYKNQKIIRPKTLSRGEHLKGGCQACLKGKCKKPFNKDRKTYQPKKRYIEKYP